MATLLVVTGDLHVNSTVALSPPGPFELDDGQVITPSKPQAWINEKWAEFWAAAAAEKKRLGVECVVLLTGELADDLKHTSTQLVTKNGNDIGRMSLEVLKPAVAVADRIYVTRGSEAHSGQSSSLDEALARAIGAVPEGGKHARWIFRGTIDGVRIDATHHPGTGHSRPWTKGADANRLAQMVMAAYVEQEQRVPHLAIRGHNHKPSDSADNHLTRAIILPSWQLSNAFGYRISHGSEVLPIGGMMMVLDDGQIVSERKMFYRWPVLPRGWRKA